MLIWISCVFQVRRELDKGVWAGVNPQAIFLMLKKHLNLPQFIRYLLADINNQVCTQTANVRYVSLTPRQSDNADRLINRDVIFRWVQEHMSGDDAHLVFYDEERASDFADQVLSESHICEASERCSRTRVGGQGPTGQEQVPALSVHQTTRQNFG